MKNPPHPGKVVRLSCLEPLGLSVTDGAKVLGVSRQARNLPTILGHEAHGFREVFPEGRIHRPNPYPLR